MGPTGSYEAFVKAKKAGKVRHIGFTGHHDPAVHMALLKGGEDWETIQHPVNLIDPHYLTFRPVMQAAREKGLGLIAMKTNAIGHITENNGIATIPECLRYAMAKRPHAIVSGVETIEQLNENVATIKTAKAFTDAGDRHAAEPHRRRPRSAPRSSSTSARKRDLADVFSKEERSRVMRQVKGANTKPEMRVRRFLHGQGFRYSLHRKDLPGKPDIVLRKYKTVVFVHGCFWHGHPGCKAADLPASNREYWERKIGRNVERDRQNQTLLGGQGWRVIVVWECRLGELEAQLAELIRTRENQTSCDISRHFRQGP